MSWVTTIWAMAAAVSLTLGAIHSVVWIRYPKGRINLVVTILAMAVAVLAGLELWMMKTADQERLISLVAWRQAAQVISVIALAAFVQLYFRLERVWPLRAFIGFGLVVVGVSFATGGHAFRGVEMVRFFGERVPVVAAAGWLFIRESIFLWAGLVFVSWATVRSVKSAGSGDRGRHLVVGSCLAACLLLVIGLELMTGGRLPHLGSLGFVVLVGVIGYELSHDVIRASRLSRELRKNSESMSLAAAAARLALWRWEIDSGRMWVSSSGRQLYGIPETGEVDLQRFLDTLHPDDRELTRQAAQQALAEGGVFQMEYRVALPGQAVRWIGARGEVEFGKGRRAVGIRGVSMDITERRYAEAESGRHRTELAHLSRVSTLSELSGSLAHELNQPLAIILSNAQAAQRLLNQMPPDLEEVRDILTDIIREDRRAGEVIKRLRALMKRGETEMVPLCLNEVITEVVQLTNADLISRGVAVVRELPDGLPPVLGDRVQLQQVVLNLILNGADATVGNAPGTRQLRLTTALSGKNLRFSVRDSGHGLMVDAEELFAPFYTTKPQGLGMGLAICRSIATAHHGTLNACPGPEGGAVFTLELPADNEQSLRNGSGYAG